MKNLYSPSMLKSYLSCKYTIFNEVNEKKLNLKKIELSKNDQLRVEKGNVHEKNYLKELKKKFKKVIDLKNSDLSKDEKVPKTIQAMKEGWEIIYGGYLKRDKWRGEFENDAKMLLGAIATLGLEALDDTQRRWQRPSVWFGFVGLI